MQQLFKQLVLGVFEKLLNEMRAHFNVTLSKYSVDSAIEIWGTIEIKGTFLCQC